MKIRAEYNDEDAIQFEIGDDLDIHEMMDVVERLLIALTYSSEVVKEGFIEKADELKDE